MSAHGSGSAAAAVGAATGTTTAGGHLTATDLSFAYHPGAAVLAGTTLDIPAGAFLGIVGPNGAGKSTLLHLLSGALTPSSGSVQLDDRPLSDWKRRDIIALRDVCAWYGFNVPGHRPQGHSEAA